MFEKSDREIVFVLLKNMIAQIKGLYSAPGLAKLVDVEDLKLSDEANRFVMRDIVSKIGITVGQKIAQKRKQKLSVSCIHHH